MSPEQILEMSVAKIEWPETYDIDGYPVLNGLMDIRLGVSDPNLKCGTCGQIGGQCDGHFGHIELAKPVIHVGFAQEIYRMLCSTCSECGRILLNEMEIEEYTEKLNGLYASDEYIEDIINEIYMISKERKHNHKYLCPHCGSKQSDIEIIRPTDFIEVRKNFYHEDFSSASERYLLSPSEVRHKLSSIPDSDAYLLGVNPIVARPEWMVLTILPVPSIVIRPSIPLSTGERSEDDLTHKLVDILRINNRLIDNMEYNAPSDIISDLWLLLQYHVTTYFDNNSIGIPPSRHLSGRPLKTLANRLTGKNGRFRANLLGKGVNNVASSVITPDPKISISEVGVPEIIAKELTVPVIVNESNMAELKEAILNGFNVHPGANFVTKIGDSSLNKYYVLDFYKSYLADTLEYGDIVYRHIKDGDIVLFNRKPSLHRMSMMAHEVKILPYKTFRLNPTVCEPYNASFDGDMMNMHVLQSNETRAEAKTLLMPQKNIISPRFGGPIIGLKEDCISGAYLFTRDGYAVQEDVAFQMFRKSHLLDNAYVNKKHLERKYRDWTGKEIFSLLLPDDFNMKYKSDRCRECEFCQMEFCINESYVVIKDGQLLCGALDHSGIGSYCGQIIHKITNEYGSARAKEFLDRSTELFTDAITRIGISTSTNDQEVPEETMDFLEMKLDYFDEQVEKLYSLYEEGILENLPGYSIEETLEKYIIQILGEARDTLGYYATNRFRMGKSYYEDDGYIRAIENDSLIMARIGARVSMLNIAQIDACLGLQTVRGKLIKERYHGRILPHFRKYESGIRANGFVSAGFKQGLDPIEFFFHAIAGRGSLIDMAIFVAQTGYMHRKLSYALIDLHTDSNGVVKDSRGKVIQKVFAEDGLDPTKTDFGAIADLDKLIDEMRIKDK